MYAQTTILVDLEYRATQTQNAKNVHLFITPTRAINVRISLPYVDPECYDLVYNSRKTSRSIDSTSPSTLKTTTVSDNKESITPSRKELMSTDPDSAPSRQKGFSIDPDSESDLDIKILIPICIGIASLIAVILVCAVYRSRKECSIIRDIISRICTFRTKQKHTSFNENINTHIENTPLKEETTDHCSVNMEPS
ncbi:uncharacterized protein LOC134247673 [Saccostrea cucullata]|uniref:uncharacterized protein LOC134247673 n=1 Tax=Saccostrea cuccullata TaxID=36930 RepID=UPI002ED1316D